MRRITPAVIAAKKRREREDAAERLTVLVPELESLSMRIDDCARGLGLPLSYVRHIIIATAPAVFDIPCGDPKCEEGGHDLTRKLMRGLRKGETVFEGRSRCRGHKNGEPCDREVTYLIDATYADAPLSRNQARAAG